MYFEVVRMNYLDLAERNKGFLVLDARKKVEELREEIYEDYTRLS